jgi:5-formyltetrahydrofolate cyclo-ligase
MSSEQHMENEEAKARWVGRNSQKDEVRAGVWQTLEDQGVNIGPTWSHIPNFVGAEKAAERLVALDIWKNARVVKANPDPPQAPVRLRALQDGKLLYMPVPELVKDFPFVRLDPEDLEKRGIPFEEVAFHEGAVKHGVRVKFQEMEPIDLVVVGCVAVTRAGGRTGKGGGFADLELGIFREFGLVNEETPIVTTVHAIQVVDDNRVVMAAHDTPLDWLITPEEVIETRSQYPWPGPIDWERIEQDQYQNIPFLEGLKESLAKE